VENFRPDEKYLKVVFANKVEYNSSTFMMIQMRNVYLLEIEKKMGLNIS
jgi:hypothetical protein